MPDNSSLSVSLAPCCCRAPRHWLGWPFPLWGRRLHWGENVKGGAGVDVLTLPRQRWSGKMFPLKCGNTYGKSLQFHFKCTLPLYCCVGKGQREPCCLVKSANKIPCLLFQGGPGAAPLRRAGGRWKVTGGWCAGGGRSPCPSPCLLLDPPQALAPPSLPASQAWTLLSPFPRPDPDSVPLVQIDQFF